MSSKSVSALLLSKYKILAYDRTDFKGNIVKSTENHSKLYESTGSKSPTFLLWLKNFKFPPKVLPYKKFKKQAVTSGKMRPLAQ